MTSRKNIIPLAQLALGDTENREKQAPEKYVIQTLFKPSVNCLSLTRVG